MSIHFLDAVIIGSVPLMLDLIDLGRDHEDFFEVWGLFWASAVWLTSNAERRCSVSGASPR
jgi:hypothetical protein